MTSIDDSSSPPMTSSGTVRPSPSGVPAVMPLMVTLLRLGLAPRMLTKRPSPWS